MFFRSNDTIPYQGKIIGSDVYENDSLYRRENAFDGDPLTNFQSAQKNGAWVGIDFGKPTEIKRIVCLPRSDDNTIRVGDEYELFYWSSYGWKSLGKQVAKKMSLSFTCVPENALLWLRDLTRGTEERIFTYEEGMQIWW
jgi:hypothetical protein